MSSNHINQVLVYVVMIKTKEELIAGDFGMAYKLLKEHPSWAGTYRAVWKDINTSISFVEGDKSFVAFEYIYTEKLTLKMALEVCPEVLILFIGFINIIPQIIGGII